MRALQAASTYHGLIYLPCCVVGLHAENDLVLKSLAILSFITVQAAHSALFLALVTKYLSIYHSHIIYSLDEDLTLTVLKAMMAVLPVILATIQYTLLSDIKSSTGYMPLVKNLLTNSDHSMETELIKTVGFMVIFAFTITLYGRLEYEENQFSRVKKLFAWLRKKRVGPENGNVGEQEVDNQNNEVEYKISVLRIALLLLAIFFVLTVLFRTGKSLIVIFICIYTLGNVVLPSIFIYNHNALRHHADTKVAYYVQKYF